MHTTKVPTLYNLPPESSPILSLPCFPFLCHQIARDYVCLVMLIRWLHRQHPRALPSTRLRTGATRQFGSCHRHNAPSQGHTGGALARTRNLGIIAHIDAVRETCRPISLPLFTFRCRVKQRPLSACCIMADLRDELEVCCHAILPSQHLHPPSQKGYASASSHI